MSLQHLAWAVGSLWQIDPAGWGIYAAAVVELAAGSEDAGLPPMTRVCAGITRSGGRCTVSVSGAQQFCHLHDPSRADERRRNASRAGRSKPASREIGQIKTDIKRVIEDVRDARQDRGVGAVVGGLYNTLLKAIETARRRREQEEMEDRLQVLEHALEAAEAARGA